MFSFILSTPLILVATALSVFGATYLLLPKIRTTALKFNIVESPNSRSSHTSMIPTFGGIAFYVSYIISLFFSQTLDNHHISLTLLVAISILFFTGLLDDIKNISPKLKFLGQFIAVSVLMVHPDFRILSFHGFMGVNEIPIYLSVAGSMFFLLGLINAFNLIDGIDGLSGITGVIIASFYSFMFYKLGYFFYLSISLSVIAMLLAFLRFNFSKSKKIFMGDTGSLVIGLVLGLLTLKIMSQGVEVYSALSFNSTQLPLFLLGVLFVPIFDTLRVMLLRIIRGVSIFQADKNHIHHILIDFGYSHSKASVFIGFVNFMVASTMFVVIRNFNSFQSAAILFMIFAMGMIVMFLMNKNISAIRLKLKIKQVMLRMFL